MAGFFEDIVSTFDLLASEKASDHAVLEGIESVTPADIPEPYRTLLVHEKDMTGTLAAYWGMPITLQPVAVQQEGDVLYRQVVLTAGRDRIPVEAGAIKIYLNRYPPEAQAVIMGNRQPLGAILTVYRVAYVSAPRGFFRLPSNSQLKDSFSDPRDQMLYGRRNRLTNPAGEPLADVLEILPATLKT